MSTKKISINPEFFNLTSKKKKKTRKQKPDFSLVKPNTIKQKLIQKVKQHKNNELEQLKDNKNKNNQNEEFNDNFKNSIDYLQSLSKKHQQKKLEKKKRRLERKNKTLKKSSLPPAPPYGILKNGKKPTYSQYRASIKNNSSITPEISPEININTNDVPIITDEFYDRKNTLLNVKNAFKTEDKKTSKLEKVKFKQKHTKTKKIIHLGKKEGNVGVLIKNKKTRKKVKKAVTALKNKSLANIKKYLKKHNLIKIGSNAPENILRGIYENSYLAGDVYNKNKDILLHNFTQE